MPEGGSEDRLNARDSGSGCRLTKDRMMVVSFGIKTYYSIQHAQAAAYFARQATLVEKTISDETSYEAVVLKAYVASTLFSSVAFLEALANELFADASQADGGHLSSLPESARDMVSELGETEAVQRAPVLSKFDLLLRGAGKLPPPKSEAPYQTTSTLVRLRNEIVHYKASFFDIGSEGMVRPGSFHLSNLPKQIKGLFPYRASAEGALTDAWLSSGCARWASCSAVAHADAVFDALGVPPYYNHVREALVVG